MIARRDDAATYWPHSHFTFVKNNCDLLLTLSQAVLFYICQIAVGAAVGFKPRGTIMQLYSTQSAHPVANAQRNLCGRTHYVDQDTLRFHKSRIISSRHTDGGLLFAIVTSDALDYQATRRGFRFVIFDLFGTVLERTSIEGAFRTSAQATKAMWDALNAIDAKAVTLAAIARAEQRHAAEMAELRSKVGA